MLLPSGLRHMLATYVHDLSPFLVRFGESFGIRWYGLAYVVSFLVGWVASPSDTSIAAARVRRLCELAHSAHVPAHS